tara:strand:- start:38 stop:601 length:564 start_codon:yes stop_codon:yes gene_type:complete
MTFWLKQKYYISIIILTVFIDQISKLWIVYNFKEPIVLIKNFIKILYIENNGIAFGLEFGGDNGKILLTVLRIIILCFLFYYLLLIVNKNENKKIIIAIALIVGGAIGNIIDSVFYGVFFNYEGLLQGKVVDMIHFSTRWPSWFPFNLSGKLIFSPVFNVADSAITVGAFFMLFSKSNQSKKPLSNK